MRKQDRLFIAGAWVPVSGTGFATVSNPATEAVIGQVPLGDERDVARAVAAARQAFAGWAATPRACGPVISAPWPRNCGRAWMKWPA